MTEGQEIQFKVDGTIYGGLAILFQVMKLAVERLKIIQLIKLGGDGKTENIIDLLFSDLHH